MINNPKLCLANSDFGFYAAVVLKREQNWPLIGIFFTKPLMISFLVVYFHFFFFHPLRLREIRKNTTSFHRISCRVSSARLNRTIAVAVAPDCNCKC